MPETYEHVTSPPGTVAPRTFLAEYDDTGPDGSIVVTTPDGDVLDYVRDVADRIVAIRSNGGGAGEIDSAFDYFDDGSLRTETRADGTSSHYTYFANGLVESIEHRSAQDVLLRLDYLYDARNLPSLVGETSPSGLIVFGYVHDSRRRLSMESRLDVAGGGLVQRRFFYDQVGNRIGHDVRVDGDVTELAFYHYDTEAPATYQSHNNRLTYVERFDGTGAQVSTTWLLYENPFGNVSHAVENAVGTDEFVATAFVYTERGLPWLVWEESWTDTGSGPTGVVRGDILETRQTSYRSRLWRRRDSLSLAPVGTAEWTSRFGSIAASFVVDPADGATTPLALGVDGVARIKAGELETDLFDRLGSVRVTMSAGGETEQSYSAYGRRLTPGAIPDAAFGGREGARHGFGGQPLASGELVKMGYRFYAPELGRFTMRDPISVRGGSGVYSFVHNTPTELVDPSGLAPHGGAYRGPSKGPPPIAPLGAHGHTGPLPPPAPDPPRPSGVGENRPRYRGPTGSPPPSTPPLPGQGPPGPSRPTPSPYWPRA